MAEALPDDEYQSRIEQAAGLIASAEALLIGAGAGMGVDSGLPDFRGDEGFWRAYPQFRQLGLSFVDLANPHWFDEDPQRAWGFYGHRFELYRRTEPHAGFKLLKRWGQRCPAGSFVFTSNVDGHFQRAGFAAEQLLECHGSINHLQCSACCSDAIWPAAELGLDVDEQALRLSSPLPRCPHCGAVARPNILMFGDSHWLAGRFQRQAQRYRQWLRGAAGARLVVIELGAGSAVPTVRHQCESLPGELIRINPHDWACDREDSVSLPSGALLALRAIGAKLAI